MSIRIALAGNPNCGKTTMFNALTGSNQYVGNWPGVTVEKKEGKLKKNDDVTITDLPGIYSLSPYTLEEVVARNYLLGERPDAIINLVDGTNLERNLYLTTQLKEIGIPVVIAINMMDVVEKNGDKIDVPALSKALGCPIVEISALKGTGINEAADAAIEAAKSRSVPRHIFSGTVEHVLAHIEEAVLHDMPEEMQRWYAVKLFERDENVLLELDISEKIKAHIESDIAAVEEELDDDSEAIITNERYLYVARVLKHTYKKKHVGKLTLSDKIDRIVTNRILALPIFALAMFLVYFLSIGSVGAFTVEFMTDVVFGKWIIPFAADSLLAIGCAEWLVSLVADGILGGVGSVLGFVPQMLILFTLLSLLEDCGYMSRIAFIMDRIFRKLGLSGKSFIPMLVATGCGVPGIMASRTIEQERDRRMTVMTTGFIPCGAKIPLIAFVAGAFFNNSPLIATSAYFIGIAAVVISGLILKKTKPFAGKPAPFVMELPSYHAPLAKNVLRTTFERGWSFIKRAGSVIVVASIIIWILNSLSFEDGFHYITETRGGASVLESLGAIIAPIFAPIGFGTWQATVATILGLLAKEEIVGFFGTLEGIEAQQNAGALFFNSDALAGFSFMIFNLLCAPCFGAMAAIKKEMNDWRWTLGTISYMCAFAYISSLIFYQFGSWFTGNGNILGTAFALIALVYAIYLVFRPNKNEATK